jgi:drug/metabolite transporter (DMT)-like permease
MYAAFQHLPASMIASLSFIYPVVAIIVDVVFVHTQLTGTQMLGILLIRAVVVANQRGWDLSALRQARQVQPGCRK